MLSSASWGSRRDRHATAVDADDRHCRPDRQGLEGPCGRFRGEVHEMIARSSFAVLAAVLGWSLAALAGETPQPPRAARSVHLGYPASEAAVFYNEMTIEKSVPGSYFMACGFRHGYFGQGS